MPASRDPREARTARETVLIVRGDPQNREVLERVLQDWNLGSMQCSTFDEAVDILSQYTVLLAFCDLQGAGGELDGLARLTRLEPAARVVALVPEGMGDNAYRAVMQTGAFNAIASPCRRSDVQWTILFALRDYATHGGDRSNRPSNDEKKIRTRETTNS